MDGIPEAAVDLSQESAERLEATRERFGPLWRRYGFRKLMTAFLVFLVVLALAALGSYLGVYHPTDNPASWVGSPLVKIAVVGAVAVWLYQIFSGLYTLCTAPPLAGTTPEETLRQAFEAPILALVASFGKIGTPSWLTSYICLLDQVKAQFPDFPAYVSFCEEAMLELRKRVRAHYEPDGISELKVCLEEMKVTSAGGKESPVEYSFTIAAEAFSGVETTVTTPEALGKIHFVGSVELAQVGTRWYCCSGKWTFDIVAVAAQPN